MISVLLMAWQGSELAFDAAQEKPLLNFSGLNFRLRSSRDLLPDIVHLCGSEQRRVLLEKRQHIALLSDSEANPTWA
ncbi:hypothetical protein HPB50_019468 [Hyalomma asiaticum]|uniref:Uncharacterized protein n=1 Tax=Hyalomma asiaticum TaxID=266040 RepID=A0ACB7S1K2_HYAAI|nr:hypothetical protein HPB50_019468 [Hyalomma asiaticum]